MTGHKTEIAVATSCSQKDRPITHIHLLCSEGPASFIVAAMMTHSPGTEETDTTLMFFTVWKPWLFESQDLI